MSTAIENEALQIALHQHSVQLLTRQLEVKFLLSVETVRGVRENLQQLTLPQLETLFVELFRLKTVQQLNSWIANRLQSSDEAEYQFEQELGQLGLLRERPNSNYLTEVSPVEVAGPPLSEQIITERR